MKNGERSVCRLCDVGGETINHVMFECFVARQFWDAATVPVPTHGFSTSIKENMEYMLNMIEIDGPYAMIRR